MNNRKKANLVKVLLSSVTKPNLFERTEQMQINIPAAKMSKYVQRINEIIESCNSLTELDSCCQLINNFESQFKYLNSTNDFDINVTIFTLRNKIIIAKEKLKKNNLVSYSLSDKHKLVINNLK